MRWLPTLLLVGCVPLAVVNDQAKIGHFGKQSYDAAQVGPPPHQINHIVSRPGSCAAEPPAPKSPDDKALGLYIASLIQAGDDCRAKVEGRGEP
jgi:hypothetical protein